MHNEFVYTLTLQSSADGDGSWVKAGNSVGSLDSVPLGAAYTDVFRKSRAPGPRELVQQLIGTAYACAALNADLVASSHLRLYLRTRPDEPVAKTYLRAAPVSRKALARLKDDPALSGYLAGDVTVKEVTHHPLLDLLKRPNADPDQPGLCGYDLRWMTQLYLESVGRAYWLIDRDAFGVPVQLWLLRPHLVARSATRPAGDSSITTNTVAAGDSPIGPRTSSSSTFPTRRIRTSAGIRR